MNKRWPAVLVSAVGTMIAVYVGYIKPTTGSSNPWLPLFFIVGPWLVVGALTLGFPRLRGLLIGAILMLAYELLLYYAVFVNPKGSTAGVEYILKPALQLLVLLPLGLAIGWMAGRRAT